jgi:aristolochene synthase
MAAEVETRIHQVSPNVNGVPTNPIVKDSPSWRIPPSGWSAMIHPRAEEVAREVDNYFLEHWNFPDDRARSTFLKAGFSRVTCLYYPLAKDDRVHFACRLLTVLFLIDGNFFLISYLQNCLVLIDLS